MSLWNEMGGFFKTMRVYLLGRGALSLLVISASMAAPALGFASFVVPAVIAAGGAALSAVMRLQSQARYEEKMVDLYREDIAAHLHIAPNEVTRDHLKIMARDNEVIAQALARQRRKNTVSFATTVIAATATFGLLHFALAQTMVGDALTEFFKDSFGKAANILRYASVGIVSGASSLILHDGLEVIIGKGTGLRKAVAHDLIFKMDRDVRQGRAITAEQVYGVLVAKDDTLGAQIAARFGKPFHHMNSKEQRTVLATLEIIPDMEQVASSITKGEVRAGHMAYMIGDGDNSPRNTTQDFVAEPPTRGGFVERLGLAPTAATSHRAQLAATREANMAPARA